MALDGRLKTGIATLWDSAASLLRRSPALTILYYHGVPGRLAKGFARQMEILAAEAEVVFADHALPPRSPRPLVAITFDDAFESVAEHAVPVLARLGLPATIFAPTSWLGEPAGWAMESAHDQAERVMPAARLAALQSPLLRIGSHSLDHVQMADLSPREQLRQALDSRHALEDLCGTAIDEFAFPYGSLNPAALDAVRAAGYRRAYSVTPQMLAPEDSGLLRGRTATEPSDSDHLFRLKLRGAFAWLPLVSRVKRLATRRPAQANAEGMLSWPK